jgi:hypothetical protein
MVNEAFLVIVWALDAAAIVGVIWLLVHEAGQHRRPPPENAPESGQPREPEPGAHQIGAQAPSSQARTSGSTRGPISASTRA